MSEFNFIPTEEFAIEMDREDPLAKFRDRFIFPKSESERETIYLCGHSLGLQPKSASAFLAETLRDWAELGVEGHFRAKHAWMPYHRLLTHQTATVVGAHPSEVVVMNSLTVNLHLMMVSFYRPTAARHKILVERGAFPSDQYAVKSQIDYHGYDPASSLVELTPREGETSIRQEDIEAVLEREGNSIALLMIGGVNYVTGQLFDMASITKLGHKHGCIVAFDLAHAAGNVPLRLHDWGPDFAVWCNYKYLNGGPGCIGGCFVHERHSRSNDLKRFAGWWGHDEKTRFQMGPDFHPMDGAEGWQLSNPSIVSLAVLRSSMEIFAEAGMGNLRRKSQSLTAYLEFLLAGIESKKFSVITPKNPAWRGAQLSIRIPQGGRSLCDRLAEQGVIGDWREPDIFRIAPVPLYNSYQDVYRFVQAFAAAIS